MAHSDEGQGVELKSEGYDVIPCPTTSLYTTNNSKALVGVSFSHLINEHNQLEPGADQVNKIHLFFDINRVLLFPGQVIDSMPWLLDPQSMPALEDSRNKSARETIAKLAKLTSVNSSQLGQVSIGELKLVLNRLGGSLLGQKQLLRIASETLNETQYAQAMDERNLAKIWNKLWRLSNSIDTRMTTPRSYADIGSIGKVPEDLSLTIALAPDSHSHRPDQLESLGIACLLLFKRFGRHSDIEKAADYLHTAVVLTPDGHPDKPGWLNNLGYARKLTFQTFGRPYDIYTATEYFHLAVTLTPDGHPDKPGRLGNLGIAYLLLFQTFGRKCDLGKAVDYFQLAVALTPDGHPDKAGQLSNLGTACMSLFEAFGKESDIDRAADYLHLAVALTPDGHPNKPSQLSNLGTVYMSLVNTFGRQSDLDKAADCLRRAVTLTPDGHPDKPGQLSNLGHAYNLLFETFGRQSDLDKATNCVHRAVELTHDGHPDKPGRLGNLGNAYTSLFNTFGRQVDLDKAADCLRRAVVLTPDGHPAKSIRLSNLGSTCLSLFRTLGRQSDLDKAADCLRRAVTLTPDGHPDKPGRLNNLGHACKLLFETFGRQGDIDEATDCLHLAVTVTSDGHPDKPRRLNNLGGVCLLRFGAFGRQSDFNKAANCCHHAVALTPDGHPDKPYLLKNLGYTYWISSRNLPASDRALSALLSFKHAALMPTGLASIRLQASRNWALVSARLHPSSLEAHARSMQLLSEAVWLGGSLQDRYTYLQGDARGLVAEATAAAIGQRQYATAVEWLEQGRCIVWTQLLELRTPLDEVRAKHPQLADDLQRVSRLLEHSPMSLSADAPFDVARTHRQWAAERERLIESVRQMEGFSDFLRSPNAAYLTSGMQADVAVIVNVSPKRSDTLVIRSSTRHVEHVPLPHFEYDQVLTARTELVGQRSQNTERKILWYGTTREKSIEQVLSLLWYGVVHPVISHLGIVHVLPVDDLPHIAWCITGPLSFLPIHAAGDYTTGRPETVLHNLAVSSYTPNLNVLTRSTTGSTPFRGILAVGVAAPARDMTPLTEVKPELDDVQKQFAGFPCTRLDDTNASPNAVLRAMESHSWVHFACHASQDDTSPLQSAFRLSGANLDLTTISRTPLPHAEFAFLSACQTAAGDVKLPDEAVHLAAGLIMAGYRTVIASMWSIYDKHAPVVAEKVYEYMLEGGVPDSQKAARALHKATEHLRQSIGVEKYDRWVPYIHMGC